MSQDAVAARFEAVASRLEAVAAKLGGGGGSDEVKGVAPSVSGFDEFYTASVAPFIAAAKDFKDTQKIAEFTEAGFKAVKHLIHAAAECKRPAKPEYDALLAPISKTITGAEAFADKRNVNFFPHTKAYSEAIASLGWVQATTTKAVIEGQVEAAEFYLNQILTAAKKATGDEQAHHRAYAATLKKMLVDMAAYAFKYHKAGIDWNGKGAALSSWAPGSSAPSAPAAAPAPPSAPSASSAPATGKPAVGGLGAVFASISAASDKSVTEAFKLTKVTKDDKKALASKPVLEPKKKDGPAAAPAETKKVVAKKEPRLALDKGTWFCENQEDVTLEIPDVQMKQNVYIIRCKNVNINIPDKAKSVQVDNCSKLRLSFKAVVSTFEIVNSSGCYIDIKEQCPACAVDKSNGINLILSKAAIAAGSPDVITSNITACNIVVPGATETADPIEIPIAEQFLTKFNPKTNKATTEPVTHGSG